MKNLKISDELHKTVKLEAAQDGVKISEFVEAGLKYYVDNRWKLKV